MFVAENNLKLGSRNDFVQKATSKYTKKTFFSWHFFVFVLNP